MLLSALFEAFILDPTVGGVCVCVCAPIVASQMHSHTDTLMSLNYWNILFKNVTQKMLIRVPVT